MDNRRTRAGGRRPDPVLLVVLGLLVLLVAALGRILAGLPKTSGLGPQVDSMMRESGVVSRVTAVLLNFRGYDTLLEVFVLFLAVVGVWSLTKAPFASSPVVISPIQKFVVRLLTPFMCLVAGYLIWQGGEFAGGAFQGGAVLGGAGVLLLVSDLPWLKDLPARPLRLGLVCGPLVFLGVALWCLLVAGGLLVYPRGQAGFLLLVIETFCGISIGLTLASLFAGGRPADDVAEERLPEKYLFQRSGAAGGGRDPSEAEE